MSEQPLANQEQTHVFNTVNKLLETNTNGISYLTKDDMLYDCNAQPNTKNYKGVQRIYTKIKTKLREHLSEDEYLVGFSIPYDNNNYAIVTITKLHEIEEDDEDYI
jgi:hypothetical protein